MLIPKCHTKLKLWKLFLKVNKVVSWIETCNHYYQNENHRGESWTEPQWSTLPWRRCL